MWQSKGFLALFAPKMDRNSVVVIANSSLVDLGYGNDNSIRLLH